MSNIKFLINTSCNLKCTFCHNEFQGNTRGLAADKKLLFKKEKIEEILNDFFAVQSGPVTVKISGGEPLLMYEEVYKILEILRTYKIDETILLSNLTLNNDLVYEKLAILGITAVRINVPSLDELEYASIVQAKSAFLNTVQANCLLLKNKGVKIQFNAVIGDAAFTDLSDRLSGYIGSVKQLGYVEQVTFITDDRSVNKEELFEKIHTEIEKIIGSKGKLRRNRIFEFESDGIQFNVSKCNLEDNEESDKDVYIIPPGTRVQNFIKGKAYKDDRKREKILPA